MKKYYRNLVSVSIVLFFLSTIQVYAEKNSSERAAVKSASIEKVSISSENNKTHKVTPPKSSEKVAALAATPSSVSASGTGTPNASIAQVSVEPFMGSANLSIPIQVPPGRGGIQPNIALMYSSSARQLGLAGVGWTLDLGSIQRSTKKGVPTYDDSKDVFTLTQGSSHDLVKDPSSSNRYYPEVEASFSKIELTSGFWLITDKKGTKYYFGNTDDSRQYDPANIGRVFRWSLNRVEDINGNYMTVTYIKVQGQIYPQTISYTGNSQQGLSPYATVTINYVSAGQPTSSYLTGFKIVTAKRIDSIVALVGSNHQATYTFTYKQSGYTKRDLLQSVQQTGSDGLTKLPAVTFNYTEQDTPQYQLSSGWQIPSDLALNYSYNSQSVDAGLRILDLNGDGYPDFTRSFFTSGTSSVLKSYAYLNNKSNGWSLNNGWTLDPNTVPLFYIVDMGTARGYVGALLFDLNGDALTDVIGSGQVVNNSGQVLCGGWANYLNNPSGFFSQDTAWTMPSGISFYKNTSDGVCVYDCPQTSNGALLSDINGDGFPDLVQSSGTSSSNHSVYVNQFFQASKSFGLNSSYNIPVNTYTDFTQGATLIDLNGDGLSDIVNLKAGIPKVFINTGLTWLQTGEYENTFGFGDLTNLTTQFADINGDGLPDLVIANGNPTSAHVLINTGSGWMQDDRWVLTGANFTDYSTQMIDANADGVSGYLVYPYNQSPQLYLNKTKPADLLIHIDNGVGGTTDIAYDSSAHSSNTFMPFIVQVVKSVTVSDAFSHSYTTNYSYATGNWDVTYREFQGFGNVTVTDTNGNYTTTTYLQDHWLKGRSLEQAAYDSSGNLYSKTVNQWQTQNIVINSTTNQISKFVYLSRSDNYLYDGSTTAKRTAQEFTFGENPQYGNPTQVINYGEVDVATGADVGTDKTVSQIEYVNNTANWLIGLPKVTFAQDHAGATIGKVWFYYDNSTNNNAVPSLGRLTMKTNWLGISGQTDPSTKYSYDNYGNLQTTTDALNNLTSIAYDNDVHMFPVQTTNALNQKTSSAYYGVDGVSLDDGVGLRGLWGQTKSVTDANNQKAYSSYDVLGRAVKSVSPLDTISLPTSQTIYEQTSTYSKITSKARVESGQTATIDTVSYYDGLGRLIQSKSLGPVSGKYIISGQTEYDSRGLPVKSYLSRFTSNDLNTMDPVDTTVGFIKTDYDAMGRAVKKTNPDGTYSNVIYDHWVTTTTNENGHLQKSYVDAYGRLIKKEEYKGADGRASDYPATAYTLYATTIYGYDSKGNLTSVTDAKNNLTTIQYDNLGRKTGMNDPDMGVWQYGYDANGNLIWQKDAKNQTVRFSYDALNRLLNKTDGIPSGPINNFPSLPPITPSFNVLYNYDDLSQSYAKGRLGLVTYNLGQAGFIYDTLGRETVSNKKIDGVNYNVQRQYDALNRLKQLQYPDGAQVKYLYNQAGQIDAVADAGAVVNGQLAQVSTAGVLNQKLKPSLADFLGIDNAYAATSATNYCSATNSKGAWKFNEASGAVMDCTVNGNNGVNTGWTQGVSGRFSSAVKGTNVNNSNISLGSSSSLNNLALISVAAWVKVDSYANGSSACSGPTILSKGYRSGVLCLQNNGAVRWVEHNANGTGLYDTSATVGLGSWHHIAVTFNRTTGSNFNAGPTIYIDGIAQTVTNNGAAPSGTARDNDAGLPWYVGKDNQDIGEFIGSVDDLLIYNGILSSAEVSSMMNNGIDGSSGTVNEPPTVSISSPANNASYTAPASIVLNANASVSSGTISKVEFFNGTSLLGTSTASPYSYTWNNVAAGNYGITAKATSSADASSVSSLVNISVTNSNVAPTASMNVTIGNMYIIGSTIYSVTPTNITLGAVGAVSAGSITKIEIYNGTTLLGTSTTSPYNYPWNNVPEGNYSFTAKVYANGQVKTSNSFDVVVASVNHLPPSVSLTSSSTTFSSPANVALTAYAQASNYLGSTNTISKVEFYNGTILVGTATSPAAGATAPAGWGPNSTYSFNWSNVSAGNYTITAKAYDNNNNVASSNTIQVKVLAPVQYIKHIDYNAQGQMTQVQYGNGTTTAYTYDPLNLRLKRIYTSNVQAQKMQDLNYSYDAVGQIMTITDAVNTSTQTFKYDELNRLTYAQGSYGTKNYAYDEIGNLLQKDGLTYSYGELNGRLDGTKAGPHAVTSLSDGSLFKYDANGNMATLKKLSETTTYNYDVQNRLTSVTSQTGTAAPVTIAQYTYDGDGGRVKKIVYRRDKALYNVNTGVPLLFGNQNGTLLPATATRTTPAVTRYVGNLYEEEAPATAGQASRKSKFIYLGSTRVAMVSTSGDTFFYHGDHLGGTNVLTDQAGLARELTEYDPFGQIIKHEKYGSDFSNAWYFFTGKPLDDETGLMFYGARYYNPKLGRFITPDTIVQSPGNPQTLNRYTYCNNNPVNLIDPTGHSWKKFWNKVGDFFQENGKTIATIAVGIVVGVMTAGIGSAYFATTLGMGSFWGGVASAAASGAIAGGAAGGFGAALYGGDVGQGMLRGAALGALSGAVYGGMISKFGGPDWNWKNGLGRVGLSAVAGGGISEIAGGSFKQGAMFAGAIAGADFAYRAIVSTDPRGVNRGASMRTSREGGAAKIGVDLSVDGRVSQLNDPVEYSNVGLFSKIGDRSLINAVAGETGPVMSTLGRFVPGFQGLSLAHDVTGSFLSNTFGSTANSIAFNFQTMPIIYGLNAAGSLINDSPGMIGYHAGSRDDR